LLSPLGQISRTRKPSPTPITINNAAGKNCFTAYLPCMKDYAYD